MNKTVIAKIISAVESGGQIYGHGRWDDVTMPYTNSSIEHTVTLGAYQFGGGSNEGRDLLRLILKRHPSLFRMYDNSGIEQTLQIDWCGIHFCPNDSQISDIRRIISSDEGIECQNEYFADVRLVLYEHHAFEYGIPSDNVHALAMWAEIEHLGGLNPTKRVFDRCNGDYSLESIMDALRQDQYDSRYSSNGVGSKKYWSRHEACVRMIKEHLIQDDSVIIIIE